MTQANEPRSLPEDEEMDPVGKPYPEQDTPDLEDEDEETEADIEPVDPPFSPDNEPDIPDDPETERVVQP